MKKLFIFTVIFLTIMCSPLVKAADKYAINSKASEAKSCSIRTEANEGGTFLIPKQLHYLDPGDIITLVDDTKIKSTNDKCKTDYYHVSYSMKGESLKGYVCGDYINFDNKGTYYDELKAAGFPESYVLSLNTLKEQHKDWVFTPYKTNLDFNTVIAKQSIVGKSYIQVSDPNGADSKYLSLDGLSYDENTKTFIQKEAGGFYAANAQTVAYYMDPRNFLNERDIYMFENSEYNEKNQTLEVVNSMFKNTDLLQYANSFVASAKANDNNISPTMLAARSKNEVLVSGGKLSNAANGSKGYYNFFNIGAFSSCVNPVICGNDYAAGQGWTNADAAIKGGAYFIYNRYVKNGQNTLYFQKFNVTSTNTYANQYMTNIVAPKSESDYLYKGYDGAQKLNEVTYFVIPVYENMPDTIELPKVVDQKEVEKIDKITQETKEVKNTLSVDAIVNGSGYRYMTDYISNIAIGTNASTIIQKLKSMSNESEIIVTSNSTRISGNEKLGTGDVIKVTNNDKSQTLKVVVFGDTNGDGDVNVVDLLKLQKHILNQVSLSDAYKIAADTNKDAQVTVVDLLKLQKQILGTEAIAQ